MTLVGHFLGVEDGWAWFASDLADSVAFGDARYDDTREKIGKICAARGARGHIGRISRSECCHDVATSGDPPG